MRMEKKRTRHTRLTLGRLLGALAAVAQGVRRWVSLAINWGLATTWTTQRKSIRRSAHFWLILALMVLITIVHYGEQIGFWGIIPPSLHLGLTRHAMDRILFLLPIIYCGFVFGFKASLVTSSVALLAMLPRAIFISPVPADALLETAAILLIGLSASLGVWAARGRGRAEEDVARTQVELDQIFQMAADGMRAVDAEFNVLRVNDTLVSMVGMSREEMLSKKCYETFWGDLCQTDGCPLRLALNGEPIIERELLKERADATTVPCLVSAAPFKDPEGNVVGIVESFRDITEMKRAEEALRESEERLRALIENAPDAIFVHDLEAKLIDGNKKAEELVGYSREELIGRSFLELGLLPEEYGPKAMEALEKSIRGEPTGPDEYELIRKDGSRVSVEITSFPVARGGKVEVMGIARDITERKRAEEESIQRSKQLGALHAIAATVSQSLDLNQILNDALAKVLDLVQMEAGGILLVEGEELALRVHRGFSPQFVHGVERMRVGDGLVGRIAQSGESSIVENVLEDPRLSPWPVVREEGVRGFAGVPLKSKDRVIGVLAVFSRVQYQISPQDMELLEAIGNQIAVALENAELYQDIKDKAERLAVTAELNRIITSSLNIEDVYEAFAAGVKRLVDFDRASIALVEGDRVRFLVVSSAVETSVRTGTTMPLEETATAWVVAHKRTNIETDFAQERQFPIDEDHLRGGLRSAIRLPLFSRGEVIGTFNLASRHPHAYGQREQEILEELAGQIAGAIENDRLYQEAKQRQEDLETAYHLLLSTAEDLERSKKELEVAYLKMARTLVLTLEARDPYTRGHSERVAQLARVIAFEMGLSQEEMGNLETAARLHDLGKIGIPNGILLKPGPITPSERAEIQLHPRKSVELLRFLGFLNGTLPIIEGHHERYDGGGYPNSLRGEQTPVGARILAVADAYDAMTSARPYRPAMTSEEAIRILKEGAGTQWDPKVVEAFLRAIGHKDEGKDAD